MVDQHGGCPLVIKADVIAAGPQQTWAKTPKCCIHVLVRGPSLSRTMSGQTIVALIRFPPANLEFES